MAAKAVEPVKKNPQRESPTKSRRGESQVAEARGAQVLVEPGW